MIATLATFVPCFVLVITGAPVIVDLVLATLAGGAFVAVWRFRAGVVPVVLACAAVGIVHTAL